MNDFFYKLMRLKKIITPIILIIFFSKTLFAEDKINFIEVEATGRAILLSDNIETSRKRALEDALYIAALKEVFDSSVEKIPTLSAVGYAVVSSQPGRTDAQKRLMAIRSARMAAMRELAEQIHGIQVDSNTTVIDLMVQNDTFRAVVRGVIRGAKTVRINPTGEDTYETVLEIDKDMMLMMLKSARRT